MRKASTAVSSSLAITDTWDFDRLVIPSSQSSCFGKQQTAIGPGGFGIHESDGAPDEKESRPKHKPPGYQACMMAR